jgi:hypothetical protein
MEKFGSRVSTLELSHGGSNTGATDIRVCKYFGILHLVEWYTVTGVQKNRSACSFKVKLRYCLLNVDISLLV